MTEENQQQKVNIPPYHSPSDSFDSAIIQMTNPSEELRKIELNFRGAYENSKGELITVGEPLLNEEGIRDIIGIIEPYTNRNTVMSSLTKFNIPVLMNRVSYTTAKLLMMGRVKYEIKRPCDAMRTKIYDVVLPFVFICLKRAYDEGLNDKRFWQNSQQEITQRVQGPQRQRNWSSKLFGVN